MNVYQIVTERIVAELEKGVVPWRKGWKVDAPKNLVSGKEYRGVNVLLLSCQPFSSQYWLTFNQCRERGGFVKKGSHGCPVVFWKIYEQECSDGTAERRFVLRYYTVFNAEQCGGIEVPASLPRFAFDPIDECERIVSGYQNPPQIEHGGSTACYIPAKDRVQIPARQTFESPAEYYSTLFHELVHSTGASHRLARRGFNDPVHFGDHKYACEELVAEVGAAFLAAQGGIAPAVLPNAAAYIDFWSRKLRSEPNWIVNASAQASKAADLILGRVAAANHADEGVEEAA